MIAMIKAAAGVAAHQTTKAAGRIGVGTAVAAVLFAYWQPEASAVEPLRWLIITGANEGSYLLKGYLRRRIVGE